MQPENSFFDRLLARLDRWPLLGGGRTQLVALGLFFGVSYGFYLTTLKLRGPSARFVTWTEFDRAFPFAPWWTWVYLLVWGIGPLVAMVLRRAAFVWFLQRATLVGLVSVVIFAVLPTQTIRPPDKESITGLTGWLYRSMVEMDDPPANAAPSLHVSLSCLLAWALAYDRPRWWWVALSGAVVVWLSTLYTAQHHLIDVGTGVLLATLAALKPWRPATVSV